MRGKHILIVEDNFLVAESLADVMRSEGVVVQGPVAEAAEAIDLVDKGSPDGVLLDIQLRRGTGFTVGKALRERLVPFIVVTGYAQETLPEELRAAPYIGKPFGAQDLVELCRTTFSK